mgnify:CR=1 FL=1|jgi:hypothetical protein
MNTTYVWIAIAIAIIVVVIGMVWYNSKYDTTVPIDTTTQETSETVVSPTTPEPPAIPEESITDKIGKLVTQAYNTYLSRNPESTNAVTNWTTSAMKTYDGCITTNDESTCLDKASEYLKTAFMNSAEYKKKHPADEEGTVLEAFAPFM